MSFDLTAAVKGREALKLPKRLAKLSRVQQFCQMWTGSIPGTIEAMRACGIPMNTTKALRYYEDPAVRRAIYLKTEQTEGVMSKNALLNYWTRLVQGQEPDWVLTDVLEKVTEQDAEGNEVTRMVTVKKPVPVPAEMKARLKASELLGKAHLMFVERVQVEGDLKISIGDVLDDDLKLAHAKPAQVEPAPALPREAPPLSAFEAELAGVVPESVDARAQLLLDRKPVDAPALRVEDEAMDLIDDEDLEDFLS